MVHLQVEQSCLLMHFYDDSRDVIQFECKHFFHPFNTISLYICRLTAAGSVIPYTTIFNDPVTHVINMWCRLSCCLKKEKGLILTLQTATIKLHQVQIIDKTVGMSHCRPGLVKNDNSQNLSIVILDHYPLPGYWLPVVQKQLNTLWRGEL